MTQFPGGLETASVRSLPAEDPACPPLACEASADRLARIFHSLRHRDNHLPADGSYDGDSQGICGLSPDVLAKATGSVDCSQCAGMRTSIV